MSDSEFSTHGTTFSYGKTDEVKGDEDKIDHTNSNNDGDQMDHMNSNNSNL